MNSPPTYDAAGYREIRPGTPLASTGYRLSATRERQLPGTGPLVREQLARGGRSHVDGPDCDQIPPRPLREMGGGS